MRAGGEQNPTHKSVLTPQAEPGMYSVVTVSLKQDAGSRN
jgi:hypothetical protein